MEEKGSTKTGGAQVLGRESGMMCTRNSKEARDRDVVAQASGQEPDLHRSAWSTKQWDFGGRMKWGKTVRLFCVAHRGSSRGAASGSP